MIFLTIFTIALTIAMFTLPTDLQPVCYVLLVGLPMIYMVITDTIED